jgi:Mg-chelatase subunit ChlD
MITLNTATASEFDFVVMIDTSGSMANSSKRYPGKTRWEEVRETAIGITAEIAKFDADGIDVVVFGTNVEMFTNSTADKVNSIFNTLSPRGGTPLAEALQKVVEKQKATGKNTVAICFTDGEPNDKEAVARTIVNATKSLSKDEALTFLFVQVGDDPGAERFLAFLDEGLPGAKFDIVDAMSAKEADKMSALDLINKAIND